MHTGQSVNILHLNLLNMIHDYRESQVHENSYEKLVNLSCEINKATDYVSTLWIGLFNPLIGSFLQPVEKGTLQW